MKCATGDILKALRHRGYRITEQRIEIVEVLGNSAQPKTIQELVDCVTADEASGYRTIDMLEKERLVETVTLQNGDTVYALHDGHHHHLVCTNCRKVVHIPCRNEHQVPHGLASFGTVTGHDVTYYGICRKCPQRV